MKDGIHPRYQQAKVHCGSCGTEFEVGSTQAQLRVDVCSNCHPAYTGVERAVATGSRVERFERRRARSRVAAATR